MSPELTVKFKFQPSPLMSPSSAVGLSGTAKSSIASVWFNSILGFDTVDFCSYSPPSCFWYTVYFAKPGIVDIVQGFSGLPSPYVLYKPFLKVITIFTPAVICFPFVYTLCKYIPFPST